MEDSAASRPCPVGRLGRRFTERGLIVLVSGAPCTGYVVTVRAVGNPRLSLGVLCIGAVAG